MTRRAAPDEKDPSLGRWWLSEEWRGHSFSWDLWYSCNYRCSYCWWEMGQHWQEMARRHLILPPARWIAAWRRLHDLYGQCRLDIIGGEPLYYPSSLELIAGLTRLHRVSITTNLSVSTEYLETLIGQADPSTLHLSGSFHPQFSKWSEFYGKIKLLKESGFEPFVNMVAWPSHLEELSLRRAQLAAISVPLTAQVFQGVYKDKTYPRDYSNSERQILNIAIPNPKEIGYRLEQQTTRGKLCGAGHVYANVKADGSIFRCGEDARANEFGGVRLGNILDGNVSLLAQSRSCPYDHCSCGEFAFLWQDWSESNRKGA